MLREDTSVDMPRNEMFFGSEVGSIAFSLESVGVEEKEGLALRPLFVPALLWCVKV